MYSTICFPRLIHDKSFVFLHKFIPTLNVNPPPPQRSTLARPWQEGEGISGAQLLRDSFM